MVLVIKMGGSVLDSALSEEVLNDLGVISRETPTVIVHGGGDVVTKFGEKFGLPQRFVTSPRGFRSRYTDEDTIELFTMVMAGKVNKQIVRVLQSRKIPAVGLSGLDGGLIQAERKERIMIIDERGRRRHIDGGYTGRITNINRSLLNGLLAAGYVPVVAPLAIGTDFEALNVDGDRAASHIAGAVQADQLMFLTDVEGVSIGGNIIRRLTAAEAKQRLTKIGPGMITKVYAAMEALSMGVRNVIIAPCVSTSPISSAVKGLAGTLISA